MPEPRTDLTEARGDRSRSEMAGLCGLSHQEVKDIEKGKITDADKVARYEAALKGGKAPAKAVEPVKEPDSVSGETRPKRKYKKRKKSSKD